MFANLVDFEQFWKMITQYLVVKIGVDTAENEPSKVSYYRHSGQTYRWWLFHIPYVQEELNHNNHVHMSLKIVQDVIRRVFWIRSIRFSSEEAVFNKTVISMMETCDHMVPTIWLSFAWYDLEENGHAGSGDVVLKWFKLYFQMRKHAFTWSRHVIVDLEETFPIRHQHFRCATKTLLCAKLKGGDSRRSGGGWRRSSTPTKSTCAAPRPHLRRSELIKFRLIFKLFVN